MRKIFKKIAAFVATAAMVTTMCMSALAADTYNVAGAEGLTGFNWAVSENQMTDDGDGTWSITFENVAAGTYEFKVATNGAWDNGEYNLEGDASSGGANATVTVAQDGSTVVIGFDGTKAIIEKNEVPSTGSNTQETTTAATTTDVPQTGDATPYTAVVAAMVAMGAVAVVLNTKKANK